VAAGRIEKLFAPGKENFETHGVDLFGNLLACDSGEAVDCFEARILGHVREPLFDALADTGAEENARRKLRAERLSADGRRERHEQKRA
jgi:hypothetical protein